MNDRDRHDDARQPDPTADEWSAWLPRLDPPTTPLPQPSAPPDAAVPPAPSPAPDAPHAPPSLPHLPPPPATPTSWYAGSSRPAPMPAPAGAPLYSPPPPNRLGLAIFCTVFCFMPFGIVALVKASSVNARWAQGRLVEARRASESVRSWCLLAALVWPGLGLLTAFTAVLGFR
ncbi:hypothetical protein GCM10009868_33980 [Terrabacter aerolatus]|uniref:Interferon-induced transmembrane protein n=1 Tax=Terrabacter aerolatus TaxID=422442 RepID=A0A512CWL0_9MICO|nr:CD225/dispanin family protein [Terrabacter aerolatus]GEO28618.1 hypothetical protein TAE01_04280 [Terrabacter aerolatus]